MAKPRPKSKTAVCLRLDPEAHTMLSSRADAKGISPSKLMCEILEKNAWAGENNGAIAENT